MFTNAEDSSSYAVSTVAAIVTGATTLLVYIYHSKSKSNKADNNDDNITKVELSSLDSAFYLADIPPITTLTWFTGSYDTAKLQLEQRMKAIISKNLWLQGSISFSNYIKCSSTLSYNNKRAEDDIDITNNLTTIEASISPISYDMPISEQNNTLLKSTIYKTDVFIKNRPNEPLFKATIIPCSKNPNEKFALVVQFSHVVGDGATYYKLMHYLCSDVEIEQLIPQRIYNSDELQREAMGKSEANYLSSFGFTCVGIVGMIENQLKSVLPYEYSFLDESKKKSIETVKVQAAKMAGLEYVSTNDILVSHLMQNSTSEYGLMAINWRDRLPGHSNLHVGNYENTIFYYPEDYSSPGLIRRSILGGESSYKRHVTGRNKPFPSWYKVVTTPTTLVTNWITFAKPNHIKGCIEEKHIPLVLDKLCISHRLRMFILFRAGPSGKIGLLYPPDAMNVGFKSNPFAGLYLSYE